MPITQLSSATRENIIALSSHTSKSHRQIARDLQLPNNTVSRIIKLHQETGSVAPRPRSGRPRITTSATDRILRHEVLRNPFISADELKRSLAPHLDKVSVRTIQHRLQKEMGMPARKPVRKPYVTAKMRESRLEFCRQHQQWTVNDWKKVLFSDESTFKQQDCVPKVVRRPQRSSSLDPRFTCKTVKHSPGVMAWGCFGYHGRGALAFLEPGKKMNSENYISILEDKLGDFMELRGCDVFQQDKAPCHTSKRTMTWFRNKGVTVLPWPGNSPDLNPIENLWQQVKTKINHDKCNSVAALRQEVTRVWCMETSQEACARLVESMPRRIAAVQKARGYPTKY